jgi:hypothetical protein
MKQQQRIARVLPLKKRPVDMSLFIDKQSVSRHEVPSESNKSNQFPLIMPRADSTSQSIVDTARKTLLGSNAAGGSALISGALYQQKVSSLASAAYPHGSSFYFPALGTALQLSMGMANTHISLSTYVQLLQQSSTPNP